nr:hypothetical protein [Tanacetum cinerariifolium]
MAQAGRLNLRMQKELILLLTDPASFSLISIHVLIQGLEVHLFIIQIFDTGGRVCLAILNLPPKFGTVGLTDGIYKSTSEENKESVQRTDGIVYLGKSCSLMAGNAISECVRVTGRHNQIEAGCPDVVQQETIFVVNYKLSIFLFVFRIFDDGTSCIWKRKHEMQF